MISLKIISNKEYEKMKKEKPFKVCFDFCESPFGVCLLALHEDMICHLSFVNEDESKNLKILKSQWHGCVLVKNKTLIRKLVKKIFNNDSESFKVLLKGTPFEANIWKALLTIPKGKAVSYETIAVMSGRGKAVRAASNAVAKNFVSYLVPCHRVIKKDGSIHKYQWGMEVKEQILNFEKS